MLVPRTVATTIDKIARAAIGKDWNLYAALLSHWPEIVGEDYARNTTPVKISFPKGKIAAEKLSHGRRDDGVLHIKLPQGLVMEFTFKTDQIIQRIASYFGYRAIAKIAFEPFYSTDDVPDRLPPTPLQPEQKQNLHNAVQAVENPELQQALANLGEAVMTQKKQ